MPPPEPAARAWLRTAAWTAGATALCVLACEGVSALLLAWCFPAQRGAAPLDPFVLSCAALKPETSLDKIVVFGSSPAMLEKETGHPFPVLLKERLAGRFEVLFIKAGGVDSSILAQEAEMLARCPWRTRAFIVYAGHQDFNTAYMDKCSFGFLHRRIRRGWWDEASPWLLRNLRTVRLLAFSIIRRRNRALYGAGEPCPMLTDADLPYILSRNEANMRRLVRAARSLGARTIFATQVLRDTGANPQSRNCCASQGDIQRLLARGSRDVEVVDFAEAVSRLPRIGGRCGLFEAGPGPDGCGDPYHLGVYAHALLADMLYERLSKEGFR